MYFIPERLEKICKNLYNLESELKQAIVDGVQKTASEGNIENLNYSGPCLDEGIFALGKYLSDIQKLRENLVASCPDGWRVLHNRVNENHPT